MPDKSIQLFKTIKNALLNGQIGVNEIDVNDIASVVSAELEIYKQAFAPDEYCVNVQNWNDIVERCKSGEMAELVSLLQEGILLLSCFPDISVYMTEEHWKMVYGDKYDNEIAEIARNIAQNGYTSVFNYTFADKYKAEDFDVNRDENKGRYYTYFEGKKMFFPYGWSEEKVRSYLLSIMIEQDSDSPHCYEMEGYGVKAGDVVVDAGVAEGNFALKVIDKVDKIYLVEADPEWAATLKDTFEPYQDKVEIINCYLDSKTDDNHITLDDICQKANYIKMDIEGYERDALLGADRLLRESTDIRLAVCTYHREGDQQWITEFLSSVGYSTENSKGYMFPDWEVGALVNAELRRGLIFGKKENNNARNIQCGTTK